MAAVRGAGPPQTVRWIAVAVAAALGGFGVAYAATELASGSGDAGELPAVETIEQVEIGTLAPPEPVPGLRPAATKTSKTTSTSSTSTSTGTTATGSTSTGSGSGTGSTQTQTSTSTTPKKQTTTTQVDEVF